MAYRRRQQQGFSKPSFSTFEQDATRNCNLFQTPNDDVEGSVSSSSSSSSSSLAAKAIRASSARRDSSLSSLYGLSSASSPVSPSQPTPTPPPSSKDSRPYEYTSMKNLNESKNGFWGVLTRKAKSIIEDDNVPQQSERPGTGRSQVPGVASRGKFQNSNHLEESNLKRDSPAFIKGFDAITSSLSQIGGTIGKSLEEGLTIVESRTSDIIQETRKHIRKKPGNFVAQNQETNHSTLHQSQLQNQMSTKQTDQDLQLKASRDVAMAMAAKAKLLLRELKTVKTDLAFAKDQCAHLEEQNKILRENRERGDSHDDDDLIRLQLESLLAEKARLAHENSVYARENRFLREVVEYHQLTMQDVVYFDESNEEVTEVNPLNLPPVPNMSVDSTTPSTTLLSLCPEPNLGMHSELTKGISSTLSGKDAKNYEVTVKDSQCISSVTGHDAK